MEFSDFQDIFAESCFPQDQGALKECTNEGVALQQAEIDDSGVGPYILLRIDPDKKDPFPYFKQGEPYHLKRICDYIILANIGQNWYPILVELKSGGGTALQQLENSECLWRFILNIAEQKGIDVSNIGGVIRVKLHQPKKQGTKFDNPRFDIQTKCIVYQWKQFSLHIVFHIATENGIV